MVCGARFVAVGVEVVGVGCGDGTESGGNVTMSGRTVDVVFVSDSWLHSDGNCFERHPEFTLSQLCLEYRLMFEIKQNKTKQKKCLFSHYG